VAKIITNTTMKMWCLRIRIKRNDEIRGKRLQNLLLDLLMEARIDGATVWTGLDGFGKRGRATTYLEGVLINMPLIVEVIDEESKLKPLLAQIKEVLNGKGLITLHEVVVLL
jgi:PII-like signaling protein